MVTSHDNKGHIATDATYSVWKSLWRELTATARRSVPRPGDKRQLKAQDVTEYRIKKYFILY